jgi:WD repeat-containing protein 24
MTSVGRVKGSSSPYSRHVLFISAYVTQVRWRPPSIESLGMRVSDESSSEEEDDEVDPHDSMLAVSARLTSAGGSGVLSMWSFHRPFMALSSVEGHREGAVADFVWLQSPLMIPRSKKTSSNQRSTPAMGTTKPGSDSRLHRAAPTISDVSLFRPSGRGRERALSEIDNDDNNSGDGEGGMSSESVCVWQHVLSVGRDGRCILQSFARGDRPISRVASSCFAMANLSPFQQGYGSLQCFSAYQAVPNRPEDDFALTYLRQDQYTANQPGIFHEDDIQDGSHPESMRNFAGQRLPSTVPELVFTVIDQGELDENGLPINQVTDMVCVAPEVVHLSRFASAYKLYPDDQCPRRVDLCLHNRNVADDLKFGPVARMWATVARLLKSAGVDELPSIMSQTKPSNVFQLAILPTMKDLLLERAEAGDVQTCVALCEVLQVIQLGGGKVCIPGLEISLVREWYLAYIDLLHQMCLFSAASLLIKNCVDEVIGALNQQSTT